MASKTVQNPFECFIVIDSKDGVYILNDRLDGWSFTSIRSLATTFPTKEEAEKAMKHYPDRQRRHLKVIENHAW